MRRTLTISILLLSACAPSQQRLLAGRHYREALAGVEQGGLDGEPVFAAIARDLELGVHLRGVPVEQLRAQLPGAPEGFDDVLLVRLVEDSHALTLSSFQVSVTLLRDGVEAPAVDTSRPALARRASESLPEPEVIEHAASHDVRLVQTSRFPLAELVGRLTINLVTVGLIHDAVPIVRDVGSPGWTEVHEPTADDYAQASPAAEAMSRWLTPSGCFESGVRCEHYSLWPRELDGRLELQVDVELGFDATASYRFPLPDGPLEPALAQVFGDHERRLDELAVAQLSYVVALDFDDDGALTRPARRELCERVRGRRGHPGLRAVPDLRVAVEYDDGDSRSRTEAEQLRGAALECGLPEAVVELAPGIDRFRPVLRIRHALEP